MAKKAKKAKKAVKSIFERTAWAVLTSDGKFILEEIHPSRWMARMGVEPGDKVRKVRITTID